MKCKIDLHVHSKYSGDNDADPEETVIRAIESGLQGIAFTEHYYYEASEQAEILKEKYGGRILILRGVEFSADEGHCLVFGADTDKLGIKYAPVEDVIRFVSAAGGVVIPSHPYRPGTSLGDLVRDVNGITGLEGYNGANMYAFNAKAVKAAKALHIPYTGGSDAHEPREVGSCYTEFRHAVTYDNFIDSLKAGNYEGVDTRTISRLAGLF
ncbi:MAG TPA: PHP-associated domain-containing protein [Nitrospirota bacterium]|nr:PHP-associated domain-containing protein [Nitrospirota bacterium]